VKLYLHRFSPSLQMRIAIVWSVTICRSNATLRNGVLEVILWKWCQNQPLQQNLSQEQAQILVNGDNPRWWQHLRRTVTPIQKTKYCIGKQCLMPSKFSNIRMMRNNYVRFTGWHNIGNYNNEFCNNFSGLWIHPACKWYSTRKLWAIIQLIAPTKVQVATFLGKYKPTEKLLSILSLALADQNLFSFDVTIIKV
jgi:hypothetical protein